MGSARMADIGMFLPAVISDIHPAHGCLGAGNLGKDETLLSLFSTYIEAGRKLGWYLRVLGHSFIEWVGEFEGTQFFS